MFLGPQKDGERHARRVAMLDDVIAPEDVIEGRWPIMVSSDHGGYDLKSLVLEILRRKGIRDFLDCGTYVREPGCDYPVFGKKVAYAVAQCRCPLGIVICTTGIGMSIVVNKFSRVLGALCQTPLQAFVARQKLGANVLVMGQKFVNSNDAEAMVSAFLEPMTSSSPAEIGRRDSEFTFMRRLAYLAQVNFALNFGRSADDGADQLFVRLLEGPVDGSHFKHADLVAALEFINMFGLKEDVQLAFLVANGERILGRLEEMKKYQDELGVWLIRRIVDRLILLADKFTSETYARMAKVYTQGHSSRPEGEDLANLERLMALIEQEISLSKGEKIRFLDVGTGLRDMTWLSEQESLEVHGIDKSAPLMKLISDKLGSKVDAKPMDMNDLRYQDGTFHVVRSQASLHHFILIDPRQGLDLVYQEVNRILITGGLFYIHTKAEDGTRRRGIQIINTQEGLGSRVYQHANEKLLRQVLARNGFEPITEFKKWRDWRGDNNIIVTAKKVKTIRTTADKNREFIARDGQISARLTNAEKYWEWIHVRMLQYSLHDYRGTQVDGKPYTVYVQFSGKEGHSFEWVQASEVCAVLSGTQGVAKVPD